MKYELWFSASENSYELVPKGGGTPAARANDALLVAELETASWEEALEFKRQFIEKAED